jgi:DNA-binding NarL/FixJ family response regulator
MSLRSTTYGEAVRPGPIVGRAEEIGELTRAWAQVARGEAVTPRPAVVTGAAGVGKTLLVAAALEALRPRPHTVLSGTARVHTPAPYDWLAAVLTGREGELTRREARAPTAAPAGRPARGPGTASGRRVGRTARAAGTAGDPGIPADALAWLAQRPDGGRERYAPGALLRVAVRTVRELVGAGPAVLVVEDLHALDPASLNLVGELAAAPQLPVLLLVTSRPPEASVSPQLVARTLARLSGVPGAIRQHLRPLGRAEVAALLARAYRRSPVAPDVVAAVWERTGGNPYWLTELLAAVGGQGAEALASEPLPEHLRLAGEPLPERARLAGEPDGREPGGGEPELTAREIDVLGCLVAGMSNKQVARSLGISIRTVTVHVSNLLRKTRSASRTEVALWAVQHRMAPAGDYSTYGISARRSGG